MIITCPNCKKQFEIDPSMIPVEGRDLQCGSCDYVWFYKIDEKIQEPLTLNEDLDDKKIETNSQVDDTNEVSLDDISISNEKTNKKEKKSRKITDNIKTEFKKENTSNKFFSYLIVFIISFVTLVIFLDTLKTPLINIFPRLELILFNLFETLKDIKLFIIDLI